MSNNRSFLKKLSLLIVSIILLGCLCACGSSKEAAPTTTQPPATAPVIQGTGTVDDPWLVGKNDSSEVTVFLEGTMLAVDGYGEMLDFENESDRPWHEEIENIDNLMIIDEITHIGTNAFRNAGIHSDYFDLFLTLNGSIGDHAFENASLKDCILHISDTVDSIGSCAFANTNVKRIEFAGVPDIAGDAFIGVNAEVYYHSDSNWDEAMKVNYGGTFSFIPDYAVDYVFSMGTEDISAYGTTYVPDGDSFLYDANMEMFDGYHFVTYEVIEGILNLEDPTDPVINSVITGPVSLKIVFEPDDVAQVEPLSYADPDNWAYYEDDNSKDVNVFLICPTVDMGRDGNFNMAMENEKMRSNFVGALNMERGIYDPTGNMFSPYYRQITFPVYSMSAEEAGPYYDIAYADVKAAFTYFLTNTDPQKPLILAGFSQGSELMLKIMKEYFEEETLQNRLVAAYAIGWRLTQEDIDNYPWLKPAQGESDTGVIIAFNSEAEEITESLMVPGDCFTYSINPLNWKTDTTVAGADLNLGACFTAYDGEITEEIPALCGAYIDSQRGVLKITGVTSEAYPGKIFPDGIYHLYDYQFFYRNLQKNVETRIEAFNH